MSRLWNLRVGKRIGTLVVLLVCVALSMGVRGRLPRNRPLGAATAEAVERGAALAARSDAEWARLEARWRDGSIQVAELAELRVRWAATSDVRHGRSRWTLELMDEGVATRLAVVIPQALEEGDLARLMAETEAHPGSLPVELQILHVGALWALGKENKAALAYRDVLRADAVYAYYDVVLEDWLRGRGAEALERAAARAAGDTTMPDPTAAYRPADEDRTAALRQELRGRGAAAHLLLWYLDPSWLPPASGVPLADLDDEVVDEVLGSRRVDLYYCYASAGGEAVHGVGTLTLEFGVDPYGTVQFCSVLPGAAIRDRDVRDCICDVVRDLRFPPPPGGGKTTERHGLVYPMKLR